jgi:hypothetical protein
MPTYFKHLMSPAEATHYLKVEDSRTHSWCNDGSPLAWEDITAFPVQRLYFAPFHEGTDASFLEEVNRAA